MTTKKLLPIVLLFCQIVSAETNTNDMIAKIKTLTDEVNQLKERVSISEQHLIIQEKNSAASKGKQHAYDKTTSSYQKYASTYPKNTRAYSPQTYKYPVSVEEKNYRPRIYKYISPTPLSLYGQSIVVDASELSQVNITGYAAVGFINPAHHHSYFILGNFSPSFIFSYKDLFQFESLLQFTINNNGTTNTTLEYGYLDWFITDNITLLGGKFYSPLGKFVNSLYPDWINKLPSRPVGFDYDEAAPIADVGFQARIVLNLPCDMFLNLNLYIGNGPKLEVFNNNIRFVDSSGFVPDEDGHKVMGGRLAFLPMPAIEIGFSAALGNVGAFNSDDIILDSSRSYSALGGDVNYVSDRLDVRAEYIQQTVGNAFGDIEGGTWHAWYAQLAYKFSCEKHWEMVARIGDFHSPDSVDSQRQVAFGINYWFSRTIVAKLAYEINRGHDSFTNDNRALLQFAYGF